MVRCRLRFAASAGTLLLLIDSRSTFDRQSVYKLRGSEKLALQTEKARFQVAPEEPEMAEEPFCEHLKVTPTYICSSADQSLLR